MAERNDLGFRVDVFMPTTLVTFMENFFRRPHLERVNVIGGKMPKLEAQKLASDLNETRDGLVYKAVREVPIDFIV